ncbi:MAG: hypothetical protein KGS61_07330 [Verrucomicrobia bacterium]|nr:hypothetical protein [Verrucomicrobiota bacterium]
MFDIRSAGLALAGALFLSTLPARADRLQEDFSANPSARGWKVFGDTNLFVWDATNQDLRVTWDSSQPDSYFYHPLGNILTRADDFSLEFDLDLTDQQVTGTFQVAVGLLRFQEATNTAFSRPLADTPDLFEFDYFPDGGFGPSLDATLADDTISATDSADFYFAYDNLPLVDGVSYHVKLIHVAGEPTMSGEVLTNGQVYAALTNVFSGPITDFRLDTVAISSFSAAGDTNGDSVLAHGTVDNVMVTLPPPPVQDLVVVLSNSLPQLEFLGRSNWLYTPQRSTDQQSWTNLSPAQSGASGPWVLPDPSPPTGRAFYRVRADRP